MTETREMHGKHIHFLHFPPKAFFGSDTNLASGGMCLNKIGTISSLVILMLIFFVNASSKDIAPCGTISGTENKINESVDQVGSLDTSGALRLSGMNEMQLYENAQWGFALSYPMNWISMEPDENDQGIVVGFLAPGEDVNNPFVYLLVQIETLPSGQNITLEQYSQAVKGNLKAAIPDLKILTESSISVSGQPGHAIVYPLVSDDATFRVLKAWTLRGENAYVFTYNAPNDRYDEFAGDISNMIKSLNFG